MYILYGDNERKILLSSNLRCWEGFLFFIFFKLGITVYLGVVCRISYEVNDLDIGEPFLSVRSFRSPLLRGLLAARLEPSMLEFPSLLTRLPPCDL